MVPVRRFTPRQPSQLQISCGWHENWERQRREDKDANVVSEVSEVSDLLLILFKGMEPFL